MERHRITDIRESAVLDYLLIILGTGVMGLSVNLFFDPASMVPGGFTGIAMFVNRFTARYFPYEIPVGIVNILINIPLIAAALKIRGWTFIKRSIFGALMYSVWMLVLPTADLVSDDLLLTAVSGGALMGIGMGFILLGKGTTGGTDTVAALIQKKHPYLNTSGIFPVLDGIVILIAVWIFGLRPSLYAVMSVLISGRVAGWILSGIRGHVNMAIIVTTRHKEIADVLMSRLNRGVTLLPGRGMYTEQEKPVLLCAVSKRQTAELRKIVYEVDESAFVIITDAKDIRGEGFKASTAEEL